MVSPKTFVSFLLYRAFKPNFHNTWASNYCDELVYKFALFWQLSHWIPFIVGVFLLICVFLLMAVMRR